jgi:hypothetical protein
MGPPRIVAMTTTIRLRGPADIITVLPYHLGYRPADSLVVVCLRANRIGVVGRVDLSPAEVDPDLAAVELLPVVVRERPDAVVLIGFETSAGQAEPTSVAMREAIRSAGIRVLDRLLVRDGRWWSLDCGGDCCPAEGQAVQGDDEVPAVADYIVRGRRPAPTRAELAGRLQSQPDAAQETRCAALLHDLRTTRGSRSTLQRRRRRMFQAWARILDIAPADPDAGTGSAPARGDEAWAWAVVSLVDVSVRDLLIAWMCPGTLDLSVFPSSLRRLAETELPSRRDLLGWAGVDLGPVDSGELEEGAGALTDAIDEPAGDVAHDGLVDRLAMVCREAPSELSPGPLTVLAHVVWWLGDGALARTALDRALDVDPDYRLAMLLGRMVDVAMRPRASA